MKYEELPENMPWQINELKHYVGTILSDVLYFLESAESQEEFRSQVDSSMDEIIVKHRKYAKSWHREKERRPWLRKTFHQFSRGRAKSPLLTARTCFAQISHVEVTEERHSVMNIGVEIEYDFISENNDTQRYFCPECQKEIKKVNLILIPEPAELG